MYSWNMIFNYILIIFVIKRNLDNSDPFNVMLAIVTNISVLHMTGFTFILKYFYNLKSLF